MVAPAAKYKNKGRPVLIVGRPFLIRILIRIFVCTAIQVREVTTEVIIDYRYSLTLSPTFTPFFSNHPWLTSSAQTAGAGDL